MAAMQDDIRERIAHIVERLFPVLKADAIRDDLELTSGAGIDSMGFLSLAVRVQKELGIVIPFDRYSPEKFTVFGEFIEICRQEVNRAGAADANQPGNMSPG